MNAEISARWLLHNSVAKPLPARQNFPTSQNLPCFWVAWPATTGNLCWQPWLKPLARHPSTKSRSSPSQSKLVFECRFVFSGRLGLLFFEIPSHILCIPFLQKWRFYSGWTLLTGSLTLQSTGSLQFLYNYEMFTLSFRGGVRDTILTEANKS